MGKTKVLVDGGSPMDQWDEEALRGFIEMGRSHEDILAKLSRSPKLHEDYHLTVLVESQTAGCLTDVLEKCVAHIRSQTPWGVMCYGLWPL